MWCTIIWILKNTVRITIIFRTHRAFFGLGDTGCFHCDVCPVKINAIKADAELLLSSFSHLERNQKSNKHLSQHLTRWPVGSDQHTQTQRKNSNVLIKVSPSIVHCCTALASLLCAGKFKVGYFLDRPRKPFELKEKLKFYLFLIFLKSSNKQ